MTTAEWMTVDNAVPVDTCRRLAEFHREYIQVYGWKNKVDFWSYRLINMHDLPDDADSKVALTQIGNIVVESIAQRWRKNVSIQASQVVSWPSGARQDAHLDKFFPDTQFAAILYLNDDYGGGQTFFQSPDRTELVDPAVGRLLIFEGSRLMHGVNEVTSGERFTNAIWLGPRKAE